MPEHDERKSYAEMTGELLREAAVLVGIFLLLDVGLAAWEGDLSLSTAQAIFLIVGDVFGSLLIALAGMILERWR